MSNFHGMSVAVLHEGKVSLGKDCNKCHLESRNEEAWAMKQFRFIGAVAILLLAMAAPSTSMAKMYNSERLDHWLNEHPGVRSKLAANPNLIYNKDFREDHPELRTFLQNHPDVWDKIGRGPGMAGGQRG